MTEVIQTLKAATANLLLPPEATLSLEIFYHVNPSPTAESLKLADLLTWTGHSPATPVEQQEFTGLASYISALLGPSTTPDLSQRLTALQTTLETELTDIQVYRIGPGAGEIYAIGQDAERNFAGLKLAKE